MASDPKTLGALNTNFGMRERRRPNGAETLGFDMGRRKMPGQTQGSDPYNTSGSFDRKQNWTRVGKR
jgi:hypothetical protein